MQLMLTYVNFFALLLQDVSFSHSAQCHRQTTLL